MPFILPPAAFDVPAIVQIAAHAPAIPAPAARPIVPALPGKAVPADGGASPPPGGGEGPQIVGPVAPVSQPATTTSSRAKTR